MKRMVEVGFTAFYAIYVHEIDANHPRGGTWKFLQFAIRDLKEDIIDIIYRTAKGRKR